MLYWNFNVGIVLGYAIFGYLAYYTAPLIMLVLPLIFIGLFIFIPSTPQFLLKINKTKV